MSEPVPESPEGESPTLRGLRGGQQVFSRYRLKRKLGQGGMGSVWLAHDEELEIEVALKFVTDSLAHNPEAVADLKRETRRGLHLTHTGIVMILNFLQEPALVAIAMEYVAGATLSELKVQQPGGCFDAEQLSPWLTQLCAVLAYAHGEARTVHRDLKPANLIVAPNGRLKVLDFGIARSLSDSLMLPSVGGVSGFSPGYCSPQQLSGEPPSALDDIYGVGALLYDLLTGRTPFHRGGLAGLAVQVFETVPPPMRERRAELGVEGKAPIPEVWERLVAACLAKDPGERPQNAADLPPLLRQEEPTRPLPKPVPIPVVTRPPRSKVLALLPALAALGVAGAFIFTRPRTPDATPAPLTPAQKATPAAAPDKMAMGPTAIPVLAAKPAQPPRQTPSLPAPAPINRYKESINLGKQARERGEITLALSRFREAAAMEPNDPEADYELAMTYGKLQLPDKADELWRRIYERGAAAGPYFAAAEARLHQPKQNATIPPPPKVESGATSDAGIAPGKTLGLLKVTTEEMEDRSASKHLALRIPIKARAGEKVNVRNLTVQVLFYDIVDNQHLVQTAANVSSRWITAPPDWVDSSVEILEVDYRLLLPDPQAAHRENHQYFGYLARVYYRGELEATTGAPERLMAQFPAERKLPPDPASKTPAPSPAPVATPPAATPPRGASRPYQSSADFEKHARILRENALLNSDPAVTIVTLNRPLTRSSYPWKNNILTSLLSLGDVRKKKGAGATVWDPKWMESYGGFDDPRPEAREGFIPAKFIPRQNPFYFALPYNDVAGGTTKAEARSIIPWFQAAFERQGKSVCRGRWLRIRNRTGKECFAQWADCGPSGTDHWQYVFGDERPRPNAGKGTGLSISPAVRDFLGLNSPDVTDWQFVDLNDVPRGPWSMYGENNPLTKTSGKAAATVGKPFSLP